MALLGGFSLSAELKPVFGVACGACPEPRDDVSGSDEKWRVEETDFTVVYDASGKSWTAEWKWADGNGLSVLKNYVESYRMYAGIQEAFDGELQCWTKNGWLVKYDETTLGPARGLIPLMAVPQRNKQSLNCDNAVGKQIEKAVDTQPSCYRVVTG